MNDVKVTIVVTKASARTGFGYPLILVGKQTSAVEYKEVSTLAEVVTAGFAATTDVYKAAQLLFMQDEAPTKVALCASASKATEALPALLKEGWRQVIVPSAGAEGESTVAEISAYIEGCGKQAMYFAHVESDDTTTIGAIAGKERTVCIAYDSTDVGCPEAAVVGATAGRTPGSFTYKNMVLTGVTPQEFADSEIDKMHEDNVITVLRKAGSIVTSDGVVGSGEYIDIVDSKDYIISQIETRCQLLLNRVPKLPYDNRGIASLEGEVLSVLKDAADNGLIAVNDTGTYLYSVTFGTREECKGTDISARHYAKGSFSFTLAGAIHTATIEGEIIA